MAGIAWQRGIVEEKQFMAEQAGDSEAVAAAAAAAHGAPAFLFCSILAISPLVCLTYTQCEASNIHNRTMLILISNLVPHTLNPGIPHLDPASSQNPHL